MIYYLMVSKRFHFLIKNIICNFKIVKNNNKIKLKLSNNKKIELIENIDSLHLSTKHLLLGSISFILFYYFYY